jgi:Domain of unknown function (DUF4332)
MVLALAIAVFVAATLGLALLVEPMPTWYYHLAWWSYIAAVDDVNRRLAGWSLLRDRPSLFLKLAAVSVVWWTLFEVLNLRLGNWYYVMDPEPRAVRWVAGVLAFATVLPGIFETLQLVDNLGWAKDVPVARLGWTSEKEAACLTCGVAALLLPLAWPTLFFPLTWGSFAFLLEPWNRRHARRSFLRDLERGEAGPLVQTLLAGLVCGALWEAWNFWARTRWIYTVPGFEGLKLFEMPLLGFLGFPPFAVECVVVVRFLGTLWTRSAFPRRLAATFGIPLAAAATLAAFTAVEQVTVDSFYRPVERLEPLPPGSRHALAALGLVSPEKLLRALRDPEGVEEWSRRSGLAPDELRLCRDRAALFLHEGLGSERAMRLDRIGIRRVEDLVGWSPEALAAALRAEGATGRDRFLERRARVWIDAAR